MKITTKKGDNGKTELKGKIIEKTSKEIKAIALIDELQAVIAIARQETQLKELDLLKTFCYEVMAYINGSSIDIKKWLNIFDEITNRGISDDINFFINPSGKASFIHLARAKAREVEIAILDAYGVSDLSIAFNRLSDVLFIYAYEYQKAEGALKFFKK